MANIKIKIEPVESPEEYAVELSVNEIKREPSKKIKREIDDEEYKAGQPPSKKIKIEPGTEQTADDSTEWKPEPIPGLQIKIEPESDVEDDYGASLFDAYYSSLNQKTSSEETEEF